MPSISNVPQIQFTETGLILPTAEEILFGVLDDINHAFGGGMSTSLDTPQGQLATTWAAIIENKNSQIAFMANQFDPQYASGFFQDALAEIYFIERKPGIPTDVAVVVNGTFGTIIPEGTQCKDTNGNTYQFIHDVTIGAGSTAFGLVENIVVGPIPCLAGTLSVISQSINGWDTISNTLDGIVGIDIESRADFERRRTNSVAVNSRGILDAVRGSVLSLGEVQDVKALQNVESSSGVINGVTLVAHSIYVSVYSTLWSQNLREEVANNIFIKKDAGANYNGATSVVVVDIGQPYTVLFQEAAELDVFYKVEIKNNPLLPASIADDIQAALSEAFEEPIGALIDANTYYTVILAVNPLIQIINSYIGTAPSPATPSLQTNADQKPILLKANIEVSLL